jgi:hypothetical protein
MQPLWNLDNQISVSPKISTENEALKFKNPFMPAEKPGFGKFVIKATFAKNLRGCFCVVDFKPDS